MRWKTKTMEFYLAGPIDYNPSFYEAQIGSLNNLKYFGPIYEKQKKMNFLKNYILCISLKLHT